MVLLENKDYWDLKSGADRSEQLEKEMLALQILAHEAALQAEKSKADAAQAKAEIERLKREAARLEHDNRILMEHYALSRHRQFGASSEKAPIGLFPLHPCCAAAR